MLGIKAHLVEHHHDELVFQKLCDLLVCFTVARLAVAFYELNVKLRGLVRSVIAI